MKNNTLVDQLREMIYTSNKITFLGGAGVSTESGIPDFRSDNGVFSATKKYGVPPETLLSHSFFMSSPQIFYDYYRNNLLAPNAKPNAAHYALAKLEQQGKLTAVITQNIDNLHQMAGSQNVLELHGTTYKNYCILCHKQYDMSFMLNSIGIPKCSCGGLIRPDVVLYGESLNMDVVRCSIANIQQSDMLIVGGTSLCVYPAAGLVDYYSGNKLVLINKSATSYDDNANLILHDAIGEVLGKI